MANSYALPRQADGPYDYYTPRGSPHHSRQSSLQSPQKSNGAANGAGGFYMNSNGSSSYLKPKGSSSLFTHAELSNETTPVVSPVDELERRLSPSVNNLLAHQQNGQLKHQHSHSHSHDGHEHHDHSHTHTHTHSLSSPMKRQTRPRGDSDLGRPAGSYHPELQKASSSWFSLPEALTSLLIPLPYMLASAAYHPGGLLEDGLPPLSPYERLQKSVLEESSAGGQNLLVRRGCGLVEACTLTSGTLLLVGFVAKVKASDRTLDRRKDKVEAPTLSGVFTLASVQQITNRALGIGLPFYASTQIGGMRTGIVLLVAMASGLSSTNTSHRQSWHEYQQTLRSRKASLAVLLLAAVLDFTGITFKAASSDMLVGYLALACSVFFISPPLPSAGTSGQHSNAGTPSTPLTGRSPWNRAATSSLVSSVNDVNLTIAAGLVMFVCTILASAFFATAPPITPLAITFTTLSLASSVAAILFTQPSALLSKHKTGLGISCFTFAVFAFLFSPSLWPGTIFNGGLAALSYVGVLYDTSLATVHQHHDDHVHDHAHNAHKHSHNDGTYSGITKYLIEKCEPGSLMYGILSERDSRRIAYFTCLNFGFMIVQGIYGYLSGSLGLLSDTVHMFFDCLGLVVGLGAAVASKWPTSADRPYGWGKLNTLAGFGNGIFLMLVSVEFIWEAMEGIVERKELRHVQELLVVSTLGFLVNMVGLFAFGHAHHGHDHGGHSHGHSHAPSHDHSHSQSHDHHHDHDHDHSHAHSHSHSHGHKHHNSVHSHKANDSSGTNGDISGYCNHKHEKEAVHSHSHDDEHNENMHGIFLHVAADAGGSLAVILSTALTLWKPWYLWDPLATIIIAVLIFAAAVPLVVSSGQKLLLVIPNTLEYEIKNTLQELGELRGVVGYAVPRFWIDDRDDAADSHGHHHHGHEHDHGAASGKKKVQGVIHVIANPAADLEDVRHRVDEFMRERRMDVVIHVEREAEGTCWCGGGQTGSVSGF